MDQNKPDLSKALQEFTMETPNRGGWKITPLSADKAANHMVQVQRMVKELKEIRGDFKIPPTTKQAASISAIWDESNNSLREMTDAEIEAHRNRPLPTKAMANVWKTEDEALAALTAAEARKESQDGLILEDARRRNRNDQGSAWSEGQSVLTPLMKGLANKAFMETKATLSPMEKAMINTAPPETFKGMVEERKPRSLWRRILSGKWVSDNDGDDMWRLRK